MNDQDQNKDVLQKKQLLYDEKERTLVELRSALKKNAELKGQCEAEKNDRMKLEKSFNSYKARMQNVRVAKKATDGLVIN